MIHSIVVVVANQEEGETVYQITRDCLSGTHTLLHPDTDRVLGSTAINKGEDEVFGR